MRSDDEEGAEAPLEAEGLLALALGLDELVLPELALLDEPDEPPTPKAASVCRSS